MRFNKLGIFFSFVFAAAFFVPTASAQTSCPETPASSNSVTMTFSVPETDTYAIWTRLIAPDSTNNSIWLQIDNGCAINVGDSTAIPANQFIWVNYQNGMSASVVSLPLSAGTHTLKLTEREGGVGIDSLLVTTNTACVPTGFGDNCPIPTSTPIIPTPTAEQPTPTPTTAQPTPTIFVPPTNTPTPTIVQLPTATPTLPPVADTTQPTVGIPSPKNNSIVTRGRATTITANATDNVAIRQVQFTITGKGGNASCTDTTFPYSCNWSVPSKPSTQYTINAVATDTSSNTATATIRVTSSK